MVMELIKIPKIENVRLVDKYVFRKSSAGTLYLTPTHLIFVDPETKKETWILHMHIASIEKLPLTASGSPLLIRCKTFLSVTFIVPKERECHEIFTALLQLSQPVGVEDLYCFRYTSTREDVPKSAGWNFFDVQAEYQRMRVPNDQWCFSHSNVKYKLCDTYPSCIYVPASATNSILWGSSKFRSKGRLPVLSYLHKNKAAICRCSQPLSGFNARCLEDEQMLNCVLKANPNSTYMYVVDTRPRINAMANRAAGKGYENENFYENIKFSFFGIENIHVMRSSILKLAETCELKTPSMSAFLNGIESSGWLRHIKSIFDTSWFIAQAVESGISVVVHCSDGWDRTAQVCSLAALLLDPYYRSIQGFQALIEKDWLSFGHKFTDRIGHVAGDPKEISPIFTQMIDCTWQLTQQFPAAFQFNERFLLTLHDHLSSCQFGTFIGNCERERLELRLSERTFSLWGYMANHMKEYMNPLFTGENDIGFMKPNFSPQSIRFWRSMYCRFEGGVHPRETLSDLLLATTDHTTSLNEHVQFLQKKVLYLKTILCKHGPHSKGKNLDKRQSSIGSLGNQLLFEEEFLKHIPYSESEKMKQQCSDSLKEFKCERVFHEKEMMTLDWKTLRNVKQCICSTPFDYFSRKHHCWQCGNIFCNRCIEKHISLPGHVTHCAVPVCRSCHRTISVSSLEIF